jgi:hypothetical protein
MLATFARLSPISVRLFSAVSGKNPLVLGAYSAYAAPPARIGFSSNGLPPPRVRSRGHRQRVRGRYKVGRLMARGQEKPLRDRHIAEIVGAAGAPPQSGVEHRAADCRHGVRCRSRQMAQCGATDASPSPGTEVRCGATVAGTRADRVRGRPPEAGSRERVCVGCAGPRRRDSLVILHSVRLTQVRHRVPSQRFTQPPPPAALFRCALSRHRTGPRGDAPTLRG